MRESRTYGFMRGAHSNMRPYRDPYLPPLSSPLSSPYLPLIFQSVTSSGGYFVCLNHLII